MSPALLILAAGRGSRFGGPKQMAPVGPNGEPLLAYSIHDARRVGFGRIVLVCPEGRANSLLRTAREWAPPDTSIAAVEQSIPAGRSKPWGTGQAVLEAEELLRDTPFGVANGDDYYGRDALHTLARCLGEDGRTTQLVITYELANTLAHTENVSRGFCRIDSDGSLTGIQEVLEVDYEDGRIRGRRPDGTPVQAEPDQPVSMNLWGFVPPFLDRLRERWLAFEQEEPDPDEEFLLPGAVADLLDAGSLTVETRLTSARPFGLTRPEDLPTVRDRIAEQIASEALPADLRSGPG